MAKPSIPRNRADALLAVVRAHAPVEPLEWLERGFPRAGQPLQRGLFFGFFAGAGRRLSASAAGAFAPTAAEQATLRGAGVVEPAAWSLSDLARAALLLAAHDVLPDDDHVGLVSEAINKGDTGERVAALRTLSLLPAPQRFVEVAIDACRSHVQDVFDAVACHNPYPSEHFAEHNFNQLVMKALFTEVPLERVIGWRSRNNAELCRMATDYEAERRAAGRAVPADIDRIRESLVATEPGSAGSQENAP